MVVVVRLQKVLILDKARVDGPIKEEKLVWFAIFFGKEYLPVFR